MSLKKRPVAIDLFAGCGGLSLGLEAAGFDLVASVEIDPIHCLVHHFNFPYTATICQDITEIKSNYILKQIEQKNFNTEIDLIVGGAPCQGFSVMGKRQIDDPRNRLVFEYLRLIKEIKPKYFLFENVPGLLTSKHQKFLEELIESFAENNYQIVKPIQVLNGADFGAPQNRKRLILIGYRDDLLPPKYPIYKYTNSSNNLLLKPYTKVIDVLSDLSKVEIFINKDEGISTERLDYQGFRENYQLESAGEFALCHIRASNNKVWGHIGSKHEDKSIQRFQQTATGTIETVSRFFKLSPDGLCNTLRAGTGNDKGSYTAPRPIHYEHPRCISVREAARLHTFPDWFQFHRTIWHGFREIGNAVIPLLAKELGTEIMKCLEVDIAQISSNKLEAIDDEILSFNQKQALTINYQL